MSLTPLAPLLPFHKRANVESLWDTAKAGTTLKKRAKRRKNIERLALATKKKAAKISSKAGDNITLNQSPAKFLNLDCEDPDVTKPSLHGHRGPFELVSMNPKI